MDTLGFVKSFGNRTFSEMPFCDADALVLSQISYATWPEEYTRDPFSKSTKSIKLCNFKDRKEIKALYKNAVSSPQLIKLFIACVKSKRYHSLKVKYIKDVFDGERVIQFCAMTFMIRGVRPVIAFRGTDTSLLGWKEDLQLSFQKEISGQLEAVSYVENVASLVGDSFDIVGHSKGGNIAAYSLYKVKESTFNRINKVFNLDGPGFLYPEKIFDEGVVEKRSKKMKKLVPIESFIGILLKQTTEYQIVESYKFLVNQHNPGNWKLDNKTHELILSSKRGPASKSFEKSTWKWIESNRPEDIEFSIDKVFKFLGGSSARINDLMKDVPGTVRSFMAEYSKEDEATQKLLKKTMLGLLIEWRDVVIKYGVKKVFGKKGV